MSNHDPVREELNLLNQLEPLVIARQEIAVMRIKNPRDRVLAARSLFTRLVTIFNRVQQSYRQEAELFWRSRRRYATVLFSTDTHFGGTITSAVFRHFRHQLEGELSDPIVIGLVGKERFVEELPDTKFSYVQLPPDWDKAAELIHPLVDRLLKYERVTFIFGRYDNLVRQEPARVTLGEMPEEIQKEEQERYVFEPSLGSIVSLFDRNLIAIFLKQIVDENYLAQFGSQITTMERAESEIIHRRRRLLWETQRQRQSLRNKKQREALSGRRLWFT